MYGMIVKITVHPGKRDQMTSILKQGANAMPGCLSYVIANDSAEPDVLWVTEVWDRAESHDDSVSLPAVQAAIPLGKALVEKFERIAVTTPVWRAGTNSH